MGCCIARARLVNSDRYEKSAASFCTELTARGQYERDVGTSTKSQLLETEGCSRFPTLSPSDESENFGSTGQLRQDRYKYWRAVESR